MCAGIGRAWRSRGGAKLTSYGSLTPFQPGPGEESEIYSRDLKGFRRTPAPRIPAAVDSSVDAPAFLAAVKIAFATLAADAPTMDPSIPAATTLA